MRGILNAALLAAVALGMAWLLSPRSEMWDRATFTLVFVLLGLYLQEQWGED